MIINKNIQHSYNKKNILVVHIKVSDTFNIYKINSRTTIRLKIVTRIIIRETSIVNFQNTPQIKLLIDSLKKISNNCENNFLPKFKLYTLYTIFFFNIKLYCITLSLYIFKPNHNMNAPYHYSFSTHTFISSSCIFFLLKAFYK